LEVSSGIGRNPAVHCPTARWIDDLALDVRRVPLNRL
jgi:hypothetical protein